MGIRNLSKVFKPTSITIVGTDSPNASIGTLIIRNLLSSQFNGPIMPIDPKSKSVCGILAYPTVTALPLAPDLAIFTHFSKIELQFLEELAIRGTKGVLITSPLSERAFEEDLKTLTKEYRLRIIGPDTIGFQIPKLNLHAGYYQDFLGDGKIAFISQSNGISSAVLDWASSHNVGFSHFITTGESDSVHLGDVIDYLGNDPFTRAILVYIEDIKQRRNFLSAARASARNKPIIVIKSKSHYDNTLKDESLISSLITAELVYDAAFHRSGILRVDSIAELFAAAEVLSMSRPFKGDKLSIISNTEGLGAIAYDHLREANISTAHLSDETCGKLQAIKTCTVNHNNLINLEHTAKAEDYIAAYEILAKTKEVNTVLIQHTPSSLVDSNEIANEILLAQKRLKKQLLTCWIGAKSVRSAQNMLEKAQIPSYDSPRMAIKSFVNMVQYERSQSALMETPKKLPRDLKPARELARDIIATTLANDKTWLSPMDTQRIFDAYGISYHPIYPITTLKQAIDKADEIGYPLVAKVNIPEASHKSDVGAVQLHITSPDRLAKAFSNLSTLASTQSDQNIYLQHEISKDECFELMAGVKADNIFGPVILFGQGGKAAEIINDRAIALPPLNMMLAQDLVSRTQIFKQLKGYRNHSSAALDKLYVSLIELAEIASDFPEIQEVSINPIFCTENDCRVISAQIQIAKTKTKPGNHLSIRRYPIELEEDFSLRSGRLVKIRPIRPEDEPAHNDFVQKITPEDIRFRFFGSIRQLPHSELARMTQLDYDREMAFIAEAPKPDTPHEMETLGVVRTATDPNNEEAEYAILVRSDLKGQKLGWKLLHKMVEYCRKRGTQYFVGQILRENKTMIDMVRAMGFEVKAVMEEDIVEVRLKLQP